MTSRAEPEDPTLTGPRAIGSGLILLHLVAMLCFGLPIHSVVVSRFKIAADPYMRLIGLSQAWPMFSPDPDSVNLYLEAEITSRAGRTRVWRFPRPVDLGPLRGSVALRDCEWADAVLPHEENARLWPQAARYVARTHTDADDPAVRVTFVRHWLPMPPVQAVASAPAEPWHREAFYTYVLTAADLR